MRRKEHGRREREKENEWRGRVSEVRELEIVTVMRKRMWKENKQRERAAEIGR